MATEPLGGSQLSLAVQERRLPPELQPWSPATTREWREHAGRVRGADSAWYDALRPAIVPTGAAQARIERVAAGGGVVVTTGQQAALFGGPLYTLAKALSALTLANQVERELGIPACPLFWAATDDADFLEASVAHVADASGLHALRLEGKPPAGTPMSFAPLSDTRSLIESLRRACGSAAHAQYFELASDAFTHAPTLGDAFVQFVRGLLEPLGIPVLDSSHPAYSATARPVLQRALSRASAIAGAASDRASAIRHAGYEPQVEDDRGLSLVYVLEESIKRRIPIEDAERFLAPPKADRTLAPNVLLRPVVERALLPTVAYVAGPAELAYFVQSSAVAAALELAAPVGVPRWSCTVIEPFADKSLQRLGIEYLEVSDLPALERRLAVAGLPERVSVAWTRLQDDMRTAVRGLGDAVDKTQLMPPAVIEGLERSIGHRLQRTERRLLAAVKRRDERIRRDLQVVSSALYPLGKRQERVLNFVPMLARGGTSVLDDMLAAAQAHANAIVHAERAEAAALR